MKTSDKGRKFIESFEGLILSAYDDASDRIVPVGSESRGTLTIGYGHTNAAGAPTVHVGQTITRQEADTILGSDLDKVERDVTHLVTQPLNQNQFDALVSFQFNTGALGRSTLLKELNKGNYKTAADDLIAWDHAGGVELAGLKRRREAERAMFLAAPVSHVTTAVVTGGAIATTAAAASAHTIPWHNIFTACGLMMAIALAVGLIMHLYNKGKTNVVSVQPVVGPQVHLG